jgi:hypothetical protein
MRPSSSAYRYKSSDSAQPSGHCGPGQPPSFEAAGVALEIGPAGGEEAQPMLVAPGDELAKIE